MSHETAGPPEETPAPASSQRIDVLMIEDSHDDAELIGRELRRSGFELRKRRVQTPEGLRAAIAEDSWDVVLCDHALPGFDAVAALEIVRERGPDVPLIVVSGAIGEEAAVALMRDGASDYVNKDRLDRLGPAVRHSLREGAARRAQAEAEEALRTSERRLAEAQRIAGLGSWEWDIVADQVTWSDELCRLFGVDPEGFEATYEEYLSLVHPEDRENADAVVKRAFADHAPFAFEHRLVRPDGATRYLSARGGVVVGPDGQPSSMFGTAQDITERQRVELERTHLAAIVESSDDAIIGKTLDGTIVSWNNGAEELYGYLAREMIGRSISTLVPPERSDEVSEILKRIQAGEEVEPFETIRVHKSGRLVDVSVSVSPVVDASGRLEGAATIARDITERKRFESQLQFLADHDVLTGLFNRRRFIEELSRGIELAERYRRAGAVVMLDVDNFKEINDTLGHRAGDETVRRVAAILRRHLRSTDVLARLGGDEFGILLPEADGTQAAAVATNLLGALHEAPVFVAGRRARITASAGVALYKPGQGSEPEQLLAFADLAMYEAKEAGRDRLAVYNPSGGREALFEARFSWAQRIRTALDDEALTLHIQPIMSLNGGKVSQCEMLLRMQGNGGELIPPGAFLGAAERSGIITELDRWVVRNAIELAAREQAAGRWESFEINISGRSIGDSELPRIIASGVEQHALDPSTLIFEVTETAAIANMEEAREFAAELKRLGCRFALDDFGAGFGSFYYLKYLPLDFLKIDGDFIRELPSSPVDQVLVRGIVEVARGLGMETIAEFVESAETLELLREYGVDYAQGFHVGRPQPPDGPVASAPAASSA